MVKFFRKPWFWILLLDVLYLLIAVFLHSPLHCFQMPLIPIGKNFILRNGVTVPFAPSTHFSLS